MDGEIQVEQEEEPGRVSSGVGFSTLDAIRISWRNFKTWDVVWCGGKAWPLSGAHAPIPDLVQPTCFTEEKNRSWQWGLLRSFCCSVAKSCPALWHPVACRTPSSPVLHYLPKSAWTYVHWFCDAIQPSHTLSFRLLILSSSLVLQVGNWGPEKLRRVSWASIASRMDLSTLGSLTSVLEWFCFYHI